RRRAKKCAGAWPSPNDQWRQAQGRRGFAVSILIMLMQARARPMLRRFSLVILSLTSPSANTADAPPAESPQAHSRPLGIPRLLTRLMKQKLNILAIAALHLTSSMLTSGQVP